MSFGSRLFHVRTSDGVVLEGERSGAQGRPIMLFLNSLGCVRALWRAQVALLAPHFKVLTLDMRGQGGSQTALGGTSLCRLSLDVLEALDALNVDRAHVCGLSLGGMVAQVLALRAPERVGSLVLAATSAYLGPPSAWQARIDAVSREGLSAIEAAVLGRWFAADGGAATSEVLAEARTWLRMADPLGYVAACAAIRDMDLRTVVRGVQARTLVVAGRDDTATPLAHSQLLHRSIKGAQLAVIRGGHLLNLDNPAGFNEVLLRFLTSESEAIQ